MLARRGFRLTKWRSSSREVLGQIPNEEIACPSFNLDLDELPIEHSLGMLWNMETDSFSFFLSDRDSVLTKRSGPVKFHQFSTHWEFLPPSISTASKVSDPEQVTQEKGLGRASG